MTRPSSEELRPGDRSAAAETSRGRSFRGAAAALIATAALLTACSADEEPDTTVIALFVADGGSTRGSATTEAFTETVEEQCGECELITEDAGGDADTQTDQLDEAARDGADVVVLDPVDVDAAASWIADADAPVITIDRQVPGADAHLGIDRTDTGKVIADAVVAMAGKNAQVLAVTGAEGSSTHDLVTDVVAGLKGRARVRSVPQPPQALGGTKVVVTGDDATAAQVAQPGVLVTGYGGDLQAVRRVVQGRQALTVYAPWRAEATAAAVAALDAAGVEVAVPTDAPTPTDVDGVPTTLLEPTVVRLETVTNTVVRQGVFTIEEICAGAVAKRCTALGIR